MSRVSSSASRVWTTTGRPSLARERELRGECGALVLARRVIVVVIQTALADGDGTERRSPRECRPDRRARGRIRGVVRMHAGRVKAESGMRFRQRRARAAAASDSPMHTSADAPVCRARSIDRLAILVERRIGEMDVAVDEVRHGQHEPPRERGGS